MVPRDNNDNGKIHITAGGKKKKDRETCLLYYRPIYGIPKGRGKKKNQ